MSINLKEVNHAEEKIVVGGIKVLGSMEGPGVVSIKQNIDSLTNAVNTIGQKQEDYWSSIASDNIITPVEKKTLKKEWSTIQTTYTSILQMATEKGILDTEDVKLYKKYYGELYDYLFKTIKVFDNMGENTGIPSISQYAQVYNNYYDQETIVQTILAASSSTFTVRNLTSLEETGTPNEIAMYNGQFYRYNAGLSKWEYVSAGKYKGLMSDIPDNVIDDYFLAASNFNKTMALKTSKGILTTADGTVITVIKKFVKGYLYECTVNGWRIISNRNDYRYIIATNDLVLNGDIVSPGLDSIAKPSNYLKPSATFPNNPKNKDYFLYIGASEGGYEYGKLYKYNSPTWDIIEVNESNYNEFMTALKDLLKYNGASEGYFTNAFINNLITNEAFIKKLATQVITLSQDPEHTDETGIIQSDNFVEGGTQGFKLTHDGNAIFQKGTFRNIELTGVDIDGYFSGVLNCGQMVVNKKTYEIPYKTVEAATVSNLDLITEISNLWGNQYCFIPTQPQGFTHTEEKKVSQLIGFEHKHIWFNNVEIIKLKVVYAQVSSYESFCYLYGYSNSNQEYTLTYSFKGGSMSTKIYGKIIFTNVLSEKLVIQLQDIPTKSPIENGLLWNDNGTLKISNGSN